MMDPSKGPPRPRKRLLTDPNPKQTPLITESPESTLSFDSSSAKKTRELPNLSDYHSCGVRINYTNPRERLHPLDSMWRIVLLCKKGIKRVNSSHLRTYCFSFVVDVNDAFKCPSCHHSIHKDCVAKYDSGLGFSVCVDCWIPDAVAKSISASKRKLRKKKTAANLPESGVSVGKTKGGLNVGGKVVGDAELAFLLHRAINSSPRISCLLSLSRRDDAEIICYSRRTGSNKIVSSGLDVPLIFYSKRRQMRDSTSLIPTLRCYSRRRSRSKACSHGIECECFICKASKRTDEHVFTSSADLKPCDRGYGSENSLGGEKREEIDGGRIDLKLHRYLLKYNRIGKGIPRPSVIIEDPGSFSCINSASLCTKGMPDTRIFSQENECHKISENCDENTNRFLLKYKRYSRYKAKRSCKFEEFSAMLPSNHPV